MAQHFYSSIPIILESTGELEERVNHIHYHASSAPKSCLVSIRPQTNIDSECTSIASGKQGKQPNLHVVKNFDFLNSS